MKPIVVASGKVRSAAVEKLQALTDFRMCPSGGKPPEDVWTAWLQEADALFVTGNIRVDEALLNQAPKLKVIVQAAVGYDNIDIEACSRRGVLVGNTPGVLVDATADVAFGLILCSARLLHTGWEHVKSGAWGQRKGMGFGVDLANKTLGIVGLGRIGAAVAARAQASRMNVIYHNRTRRTDEAQLGVSYASFDELLTRADFVLAMLPLSKDTEGMFDRTAFAKMKPTARFINVARGKIVKTDDLYAALKENKIAYAALDVTDPEPLPGDHPLLTLDNILITPHIGSSTVETRDAMALLSADNVMAALEGRKMPACVNPEVEEQKTGAMHRHE